MAVGGVFDAIVSNVFSFQFFDGLGPCFSFLSLSCCFAPRILDDLRLFIIVPIHD